MGKPGDEMKSPFLQSDNQEFKTGEVDEKTAVLINKLNEFQGQVIKKEIRKTMRKEFLRFLAAFILSLAFAVISFNGRGTIIQVSLFTLVLTIILYLVFFTYVHFIGVA